MDESSISAAVRPQEQALNERVQQSRASWRRLGQQIRAITPVTLARFLLVAAALVGLGWLVARGWPSLLPFAVGGILAYALLPLVNWLDRFIPRRLAALLTMGTVFALLVFFVARLVPAIGLQIARLLSLLPLADQLRGSLQEWLGGSFSGLPAPLREEIVSILEQTAATLRGNLDNLLGSLPQLLITLLLNLLRTISAILGLLVLPTWLLVVLNDYQSGIRHVNRVLPPAIRPDFWAAARILDRSFRSFFQRQVTQGVLVAILLYLAIRVLESLGWIQVEFPLVLALFAGLMELIPEIGPLVFLVVIVLLGLLISPQTALIAVITFVLLHWLVGNYVAGRTERKVRSVHPAVLVVAVVILSQFGLGWVLFAVPILTAVRDLFRYAYGRLSDPPRPAGLLPDQAAAAGAVAAKGPQQMSPVYRHMHARNQTRSAPSPRP